MLVMFGLILMHILCDFYLQTNKIAKAKANCRYKINNQVYVIPFGYGNRHKHPNVEVINDLISNNEEFYCATQTQGFVYFID